MVETVSAIELSQRHGSRRVLQSLTFSLDGGVVGLLGPNGAGKTTLLTTLCTLRKPSGGSLRVFGLDAARVRERRVIRQRLGFLPQSFGYLPAFTAREFVEYVAWLKKMPAAHVPGAASEALAEVGLNDRADSRLGTLSGGMLRRVGIASALVNRPDLLLRDEPTVGLDPEQRASFRSLLRRVGERSTVVLSTHLVEDVVTTCSDVVVLADGVIKFQGHPGALAAYARPTSLGDSAAERGYSGVLSSRP